MTDYLSPGQLLPWHVIAPFLLEQSIQWSWPHSYGEDKMVIMFGGLHLEMAMWNMLGDYLAASGWTEALTEAGIASSGLDETYSSSLNKNSPCTPSYHCKIVQVAEGILFSFRLKRF